MMAQSGMSHPESSRHGGAPVVPEIQGKARHGKKKANPIIPGTEGAGQKVFHR